MIWINEIGETGFDDRGHSVGDCGGVAIISDVHPVIVFSATEQIPGVGERGYLSIAFGASVPAHMIEMKMGTAHDVDRFDRMTSGCETIRERGVAMKSRDAGNISITHAGVDKDAKSVALEDECVDGQRCHALVIDEMRLEPFLMRFERLNGGVRQEPGQWQRLLHLRNLRDRDLTNGPLHQLSPSFVLAAMGITIRKAAWPFARPPRVGKTATDPNDAWGDMSGQVTVEFDGAIAIITNDNQEMRNAFSDSMDAQLFDILGEIRLRRELRCVIWRGEGHSWSSGRDVSAIGGQQVELTHHELMSRGHTGILQILDLDIPIIVPIQGWAIGGSFQRALLCDIRIAADDAHFMLPETTHGVIPDTGGVARLFQMCGHGVVSDMVLTGRSLDAHEALALGVISRIVSREELDATAREMADRIVSAPEVTIKMARRVISHLADTAVRSSMADELIYQTFINKSDDFAEFRAARAEDRTPSYRGS